MKPSVTFALLMPILLLCLAFFGEQWFVAIVIVSALCFLLEIKHRHGNISGKTIKKFFNTPIKSKTIFGETSVDNSPKFSVIAGVLIILGGTIVVMIALGIYFSL